MNISVALDGPRERNLTFFAGDEITIDLTVYEHDGDTDALTVTDAAITTCDGGYPVGAEFTIPNVRSSRYRLTGVIDGLTMTIAYGVLTVNGRCYPRWDYGFVAYWGWL